MLSTKYRLRLESICKDIASGTEVTLEDMIWANKLAKANTSARGMVSQARRLATDPGWFLKYFLSQITWILETPIQIITVGVSEDGQGADEIADWFQV